MLVVLFKQGAEYMKISEIFSSFQGEGDYAGMPSVWVRFFGCNLKCDGFGQDDPTNPKNYLLPRKKVDLEAITNVNQLPVFSQGCDSSYSWSPRFKKLISTFTVEEAVKEIMEKQFELTGISFSARHPTLRTLTQLCFTGGEPMLQQKAMVEITKALKKEMTKSYEQVTIETNATKPLDNVMDDIHCQHLHFAMSPKLFAVSGEKDVFNMDVIWEYVAFAESACIKIVHNGSTAAWEELQLYEKALSSLSATKGVPLYIMPVGSIDPDEEQREKTRKIVDEALRRGYSIATRNHIAVYGNEVGK